MQATKTTETAQQMQRLTIGRAKFTLTATRNVGELQAKLAKCTGKTKRTKMRDIPRNFPTFRPGDSTAAYVKTFWAINGAGNCAAFFQPLNSEPCQLYSGDDSHEILTDVEAHAPAAPAPIMMMSKCITVRSGIKKSCAQWRGGF